MSRMPKKASQAALALTASPEQTVEHLRKKLPVVPKTDEKRLERLIGDLDSNSFETRQTAERELSRLGRLAQPAMRKALKGARSAEQQRILERLLEPLDAILAQDVASSRAVEVLEWLGTPEARRLLEELGRGAPGAWLTEEAASAQRRLASKSEPRP